MVIIYENLDQWEEPLSQHLLLLLRWSSGQHSGSQRLLESFNLENLSNCSAISFQECLKEKEVYLALDKHRLLRRRSTSWSHHLAWHHLKGEVF